MQSRRRRGRNKNLGHQKTNRNIVCERRTDRKQKVEDVDGTDFVVLVYQFILIAVVLVKGNEGELEVKGKVFCFYLQHPVFVFLLGSTFCSFSVLPLSSPPLSCFLIG